MNEPVLLWRAAAFLLFTASCGGDEETPADPDAGVAASAVDAGRADAETAGADDAGRPDAAPSGRVPSPVPGKSVTYAYGIKNSRYAAGYHTGDDYAAAVGTPVVAVRDGTVQWSNDDGGAYGKWIGLQADNGRVYVYCHLSSRGVTARATVKAGDTLGKVGATGNVTGPHLHFEDHPSGPFKYGDERKPTW